MAGWEISFGIRRDRCVRLAAGRRVGGKKGGARFHPTVSFGSQSYLRSGNNAGGTMLFDGVKWRIIPTGHRQFGIISACILFIFYIRMGGQKRIGSARQAGIVRRDSGGDAEILPHAHPLPSSSQKHGLGSEEVCAVRFRLIGFARKQGFSMILAKLGPGLRSDYLRLSRGR